MFGLIAAASVLAGGCDLHAQDSTAEGMFERTLQVGRAPEVSVTGRSGSIRVSPGADGAVLVRARIQAYDSLDLFSTYTPTERVAKLEKDPPIRQRGNAIVIGDIDDDGMLLERVSISYDITVPADTRLSTESRSAGQTITSIAGAVDATSRSGSIAIEGAGGPLRLESRSGNVTITGEPRGSWAVETRSGEVELRIPASAAFDLSIASRSGAIEAARTLPSSSRLSRNRLEGRVGAGGPRVDVSTRSGSIRIE
jgi:hypothetical protein